jgi:hypothetical protein
MAGKKKTIKKATSTSDKPEIEERYKDELPPPGSAKYKAYVMQGLIKEK